MPTPGGLPKVGERVRMYNYWNRTEFTDGTVLERTNGQMWQMRVRWDRAASPSRAVTWLTEPGYAMQQGWLVILDG